ncbi:MAG: efflux RND transporter permease subunit, partial [Elusimicrobiota bacterium]
MNFPALAIRRPVATLMAYAAFGLLGVFSIFRLPVSLMPSAGAGHLNVSIGIRGGLPPEDIENLVTKVVEEAVSATAGLRSVSSVSRKERAVITMIFEPGMDVGFASLEVQERLAKIRNKLPKDIEKPVVGRYGESDYPVTILALTSDRRTPEEVRDLVDSSFKPALLRVDGVGNIEVGGGCERKILVEFDQQRLEAYQLPIHRVIQELGSNNLNVLTGKTETGRDFKFVRAMGQYQSIEDMKKLSVAITKEGGRIRLEDVAEVRDFYLEPDTYARLNKKPTVSVYVQKESQANTIRVADRIEEAVKKFEKESLPPEISLTVVSNQAIFIREAIQNIVTALWQGTLLVGVVLWLFIRNLAHTSIILVSIPLSVLLTFGLMFLSKIGLNVMTLSGIALGIGMLVDNSIVVLENIVEAKKHFFQRNPELSEAGREVSDPLVAEASRAMTLPILAATICTVIVFIPIVFISKQIQLIYSGLALTVTYSLICSFFVAVTVVPLLAARIPMRARMEDERNPLAVLWEKVFGRPFVLPFFLAPLAGRGGAWGRSVWGYLKNPGAPAAGLPAEEGGEEGAAGGEAPSPGVFGRLRNKAASFLESTLSPVLRDPLKAYRSAMAACIRKRYRLLGAVAVAFLLAVGGYAFLLEKDFMGSAEESEFIIYVELPAGARLDISDKVVGEVERVVSETPEISGVVKTAAARVEGWSSKVYVTLVPQAERSRTVQEIIDELRPQVADIGAEYDAFIYFSEPSDSKEFFIDVFGHDYEKLRDLAVAISDRLQKIPDMA